MIEQYTETLFKRSYECSYLTHRQSRGLDPIICYPLHIFCKECVVTFLNLNIHISYTLYFISIYIMLDI